LVDASALVSGEILLAGRNPELGGSGKASGQFTSFSGWIAVASYLTTKPC